MKNKTNLIILLFAAGLFFIFGCDNRPQYINNGKSTNNYSAPASNQTILSKFSANQTKDFGGLSITVGNVIFDDNKIICLLKIKNTTKNKISFFPTQGNLVAGSLQLAADSLSSSVDLSGDIYEGIEKSGEIQFTDKDNKLDLSKLEKFDLRLGKTFDEKTYKSVEVNFPVEIKK